MMMLVSTHKDQRRLNDFSPGKMRESYDLQAPLSPSDKDHGRPKKAVLLPQEKKLPEASRDSDLLFHSRVFRALHILPEMYCMARKHDWAQVALQIKNYPRQAGYIFEDGTTPLHLAVMSRTGFILDKDAPQIPAPIELIEDLIRVHPGAAKVPCKIHTYTPIAYACLVVRKDCNLEDADTMIRILLKHVPDCIKTKTSGSLSPLDIHIVSYSQTHHDVVQAEELRPGQTNTVVIKTLLQHDPSLARSSVVGDTVVGPIELLYRSNSQSFLTVISLDGVRRGTRKSRAANRALKDDNTLVSEITKWWVWKWMIILLKYETLPIKNRGTKFLALHAASGVTGCPLPVLTLALNAFPDQLKQRDSMLQGNTENLPLHNACSWKSDNSDVSSTTDPVATSRKSTAIALLLYEYPHAAKMLNANGMSPLELAVSSGTLWDNGIRKLCRANPAALNIQNPSTKLFPFMTAAAVAAAAPVDADNNQAQEQSTQPSFVPHVKNLEKTELQSIRTIYGLLRSNPLVLTRCVTKQEDTDSSLPRDAFSPQAIEMWANESLIDESWHSFDS